MCSRGCHLGIYLEVKTPCHWVDLVISNCFFQCLSIAYVRSRCWARNMALASGRDDEGTDPFFWALRKMDMRKLKDPYEGVLHKDSTYFMAEDIYEVYLLGGETIYQGAKSNSCGLFGSS